MKLFRKIIDERQNLELMRVERGAFWIVFLGLAVAVIVQTAVLGKDSTHIMGEVIILLVGAIWYLIGCIRRGIWDYFTKPGMRSYISYSFGFGVILGLIVALAQYFRYDAPLLDCMLVFAKSFMIIFVVGFIGYWLLGSTIKARQKKLAREYEDDND